MLDRRVNLIGAIVAIISGIVGIIVGIISAVVLIIPYMACSLQPIREVTLPLATNDRGDFEGLQCGSVVSASQGFKITGRYNSQSGQALWVFVYGDGGYWPQSITACPLARSPRETTLITGNIWESWLYLSNPNTQYDIVLVETPVGGVGEITFNDMLNTGCGGNWMPISASEMATLNVIELAAITIETE